MNTQLLQRSNRVCRGRRKLAPSQALHLGRRGGELHVIEGRLWLTRDRDLGDHVVEPGRRIRLAVDDNAVIEPLLAGESALVHWTPCHWHLFAALMAEPLNGLAFLARLAASGFATLAQRAADNAGRLQRRTGSAESGLPAR